jgi:hypothetical protein
MNERHLSSRGFFSFLAMIAVLTLTILACGVGAGAPAPSAEQPGAAMPTESLLQATPAASVSTAIPAIPERRRLTLEFPPKIRAGDSDVVRLTLEVDDLGNVTPTAQIEGNVVQGGVIEIPNLYETHHVVAEARFDIAGLQVSPPDLISQPLEQGQAVTFYWSVRPTETGVYQGTVWLFLRFVDKSSGEESRKPVSAQVVQIEAVDFFGLSVNFARGTGVIGSVVGAVVGFPFFEDIVRFIFGRRKRRSK